MRVGVGACVWACVGVCARVWACGRARACFCSGGEWKGKAKEGGRDRGTQVTLGPRVSVTATLAEHWATSDLSVAPRGGVDVAHLQTVPLS